jgi:hypothetical protein
LASSASPLPPLAPKKHLHHDDQASARSSLGCVTDAGSVHHGSLLLAPDRSPHALQHTLPRATVSGDAGPSVLKFYSQAASASTAPAPVEQVPTRASRKSP